MKGKNRIDSKATIRKRRRRKARRIPKQLLESKDLDAMAQRRCLMILNVLSGERSAQEASDEAQISAAQYYQLEEKALSAMLAALVPGASSDSPAPRHQQMQDKIARLEMDKRRLERLLFLTRKVVKPGPMTTGRRGPRKKKSASMKAGAAPSPSSTKKAKKTANEVPSTPTPDGGDAR